ncbi:hypothetical protein PR048_014484 [Dryococelus australis]|uniref:Uncharacterized protein n=1 Tax=Dryococelus australis TaxID=614101 RepID=A0ABQ9HEC4_9NEOP|nr:hypothetical protein PR048_014484 [Dryococelus australis]
MYWRKIEQPKILFRYPSQQRGRRWVYCFPAWPVRAAKARRLVSLVQLCSAARGAAVQGRRGAGWPTTPGHTLHSAATRVRLWLAHRRYFPSNCFNMVMVNVVANTYARVRLYNVNCATGPGRKYCRRALAFAQRRQAIQLPEIKHVKMCVCVRNEVAKPNERHRWLKDERQMKDRYCTNTKVRDCTADRRCHTVRGIGSKGECSLRCEVYMSMASVVCPSSDITRKLTEECIWSRVISSTAQNQSRVQTVFAFLSTQLSKTTCLCTYYNLYVTHYDKFKSHLGGPGSIPSGVAPRFSHVGVVLDDAAGRRTFTWISRFPRPCIPALLHTHLTSPLSAQDRPNLSLHSPLKLLCRFPLDCIPSLRSHLCRPGVPATIRYPQELHLLQGYRLFMSIQKTITVDFHTAILRFRVNPFKNLYDTLHAFIGYCHLEQFQKLLEGQHLQIPYLCTVSPPIGFSPTLTRAALPQWLVAGYPAKREVLWSLATVHEKTSANKKPRCRD